MGVLYSNRLPHGWIQKRADHWEVVELGKSEPRWRKKVMNECVPGGYSLSWLLLLVPFSASFLVIVRDSSASRCPRHHVALPPRKPTVTELSAPVRFIPVKSQVKTSPWAAWYLSLGHASYIICSPAVFSFADVYLQSFLISHPPHILILRFYFWLSSGFVLYYSSLTLLALLLC